MKDYPLSMDERILNWIAPYMVSSLLSLWDILGGFPLFLLRNTLFIGAELYAAEKPIFT